MTLWELGLWNNWCWSPWISSIKTKKTLCMAHTFLSFPCIAVLILLAFCLGWGIGGLSKAEHRVAAFTPCWFSSPLPDLFCLSVRPLQKASADQPFDSATGASALTCVGNLQGEEALLNRNKGVIKEIIWRQSHFWEVIIPWKSLTIRGFTFPPRNAHCSWPQVKKLLSHFN